MGGASMCVFVYSLVGVFELGATVGFGCVYVRGWQNVAPEVRNFG